MLKLVCKLKTKMEIMKLPQPQCLDKALFSKEINEENGKGKQKRQNSAG